MRDVLSGVPGCVTTCDRGEVGSKLAKNSVTYFMDSPSDKFFLKHALMKMIMIIAMLMMLMLYSSTFEVSN